MGTSGLNILLSEIYNYGGEMKRSTWILVPQAGRLHKEDRLLETMDPRLHVNNDEAMEVRRVLEIAVLCVQSSPEKRPTMFRVVAMLAGDAANDVSVPAEGPNSWPEYQMQSGSNADVPLLGASSSTTGSTATGPITNGNAIIELSTLFTR